jgi:hypothetical protein
MDDRRLFQVPTRFPDRLPDTQHCIARMSEPCFQYKILLFRIITAASEVYSESSATAHVRGRQHPAVLRSESFCALPTMDAEIDRKCFDFFLRKQIADVNCK